MTAFLCNGWCVYATAALPRMWVMALVVLRL